MGFQENQKAQQQVHLQPEAYSLESAYKTLSTGAKVVLIIGCLCIITTLILTLDNLGFTTISNDDSFSTYSSTGFMSTKTIWFLNCGLGSMGGILIIRKKLIQAAISGAITTATITGITILYTSWRETIYSLEFIVPIFLSIFIGWKVFSILGGKP